MREGGFLRLNKIGVFDRNAQLPTGGNLEQAAGTAWMPLFTQNMLEIAVELAAHDSNYEDMAFKFVEHFLYIAAAMNKTGQDGMWDEEDGFYYDLLRLPDGRATRLKVRSLVGLLPLCATTVTEAWQRERVPVAAAERVPRRRPGVSDGLSPGRVEHGNVRRQLELAGAGLDAGERHDHPGAAELLSLLRGQLQDRMSDRFRHADEPLRGRPGDLAAPDPHLPA